MVINVRTLALRVISRMLIIMVHHQLIKYLLLVLYLLQVLSQVLQLARIVLSIVVHVGVRRIEYHVLVPFHVHGVLFLSFVISVIFGEVFVGLVLLGLDLHLLDVLLED